MLTVRKYPPSQNIPRLVRVRGANCGQLVYPCDPHKSDVYLSAVICGQLRTDTPLVKFYVHSKLPSFSCGACHIAIFYKLQSQGSSGNVICKKLRVALTAAQISTKAIKYAIYAEYFD